MSQSAPVVLDGVSKRFGAVTAVDAITLTMSPGELFGLVGPDGAGKTTLFRILATLLVPDDGTATVLGHDVVRDLWSVRARVGYMPGRFSLYADLTVEENLEFFASVFGTTPAEGRHLIAPIYSQIEPFRHRRAGALSGGMKQKLALSCALVHRPELLLLDEPTTGVDAVSRREFWDLLDELRAGGLPVIVSTPYMDEAMRCDRVALMQGGRVMRTDRPRAIAAEYPSPLLAISAASRHHALTTLRAFPYASSVYPFGETLHYTDARHSLDSHTIAREVSAYLSDAGLDPVTATPIDATLEDAFMALMVEPAGARTAA